LNKHDAFISTSVLQSDDARLELAIVDAKLKLSESQPSIDDNEDVYFRTNDLELIGRVLRAFKTIVDLNASETFPLPLAGELVPLRGTFVAVGSSVGVTIFNTNTVLFEAFIPTDSPVRDLAEIEYEGMKALLILLSDHLIIVDPRRSSIPLADIKLFSNNSANKVVQHPLDTRSTYWIQTEHNEIIKFDTPGAQHKTNVDSSIVSFASVGNVLYGCNSAGDVSTIDQKMAARPIISTQSKRLKNPNGTGGGSIRF
jgi:hypothetical protein